MTNKALNIEIIADNAKRGDYNSILQLKQFAIEFNHYAEKILENISFDGKKNHAVGLVVLREGIKEIKPAEFKDCTKLIQIILPDSLISIGDSAFEGCFRLEKVFFPDNLKSIGQRAFFGCKSLAEIILPDNVKIGTDAFAGCSQNISQPVHYDGDKKIEQMLNEFAW